MPATPNDLLTLKRLSREAQSSHERRALRLAVEALRPRVVQVGDNQALILAVLDDTEAPLTAAEIATRSGLEYEKAIESLTRLQAREIVGTVHWKKGGITRYRML